MPTVKDRTGGIAAHVVESGVITIKNEIPVGVENFFRYDK